MRFIGFFLTCLIQVQYLFSSLQSPKMEEAFSDIENIIVPELKKNLKKRPFCVQPPIFAGDFARIDIHTWADENENLEELARHIRAIAMNGVIKSGSFLKYSNHGLTSPDFIRITIFESKTDLNRTLGVFQDDVYYALDPKTSTRSHRRLTNLEFEKIQMVEAGVLTGSSCYITKIESTVEAIVMILFFETEGNPLQESNLEWYCDLYRKLVPVAQELFPGKFLVLKTSVSNKKIEESAFVNIRNNVVQNKKSVLGNWWDHQTLIYPHQLDDVVPTSLHREIKPLANKK